MRQMQGYFSFRDNDKCPFELNLFRCSKLPNYPPHKARRLNLIVGVILIILYIVGLISVSINNSGSNPMGLVFMFILVFMGGYEIGKYAENRLSKQWESLTKQRIVN